MSNFRVELKFLVRGTKFLVRGILFAGRGGKSALIR